MFDMRGRHYLAAAWFCWGAAFGVLLGTVIAWAV